MKVEWSDVAFEDLLSIHDYLAKNSPVYARYFADQILASVEKLAKFPEIGRRVPEAGESDVRELIVQSYRVMYQVRKDEQVVWILAVVHGKRDIAGQSPKPWNIT